MYLRSNYTQVLLVLRFYIKQFEKTFSYIGLTLKDIYILYYKNNGQEHLGKTFCLKKFIFVLPIYVNRFVNNFNMCCI